MSSTSTREESGKVVWKLWGVGGSNGYKVRCYDKLQEAKSVDGKLYWLGVWESQGYDLDRPVWRVEYELRRSFLKCWRINTFDQFLSCQQAIQKRLFELWNIKKITDSNISRCEYVDEYKFLFDNFTQNYRINKIDKRPDEYKRCSKNKYSGALLSLFPISEISLIGCEDKGLALSWISLTYLRIISRSGTEISSVKITSVLAGICFIALL